LHGGKPATVELVAEAGPLRIEREGVSRPLEAFHVSSTQFSTTIACDAFAVRTVEHLMSALAGLGVRDGLRVVVTGDELPLLDGGARAWCAELDALGLRRRPPERRVTRSERLEVDGAVYEFLPGDAVRVEVVVELPRCCEPRAAWDGDPSSFVREIAPARTFGLEREVLELERAGLARHVERESVLVVGDDVLYGSGVVLPDEPARHKLLDLVGDAYLHGGPPLGTLRATRPGHARNHAAFARAIAAGIFAAALFATTRARADDPVRPPTLVELTHPWPELTIESTLASVTYNNSALQGTTYVRVERLSWEMPIAQSPWYVGVAYDGALGQDDSGKTRFVSGNPELWGRGVWNATYGLAFGGGFSLVIPTGSYDPNDPTNPYTTPAYAAIAARGWDRALFDPQNATLRPSLDIRLVTGPITVQYRQALEIATNFGDTNFRFAAVGTLFFGVRFSKLVTAGVDLIEYYRLEPGLPDDARGYFAVGAHVGIETPYFQPTLGVMTNIGSPLNAISRFGAPLTLAPTSFVGVHFSLDFPFRNVTIGRKKK
jgi:UDP-3-O-[3-hydroxymyristoyl] N-acetylglucosamine deacetylase